MCSADCSEGAAGCHFIRPSLSARSLNFILKNDAERGNYRQREVKIKRTISEHYRAEVGAVCLLKEQDPRSVCCVRANTLDDQFQVTSDCSPA